MTQAINAHVSLGSAVLDTLSVTARQRLKAFNYSPAALRPYLGSNGRSYIDVPTGRIDANGKPVFNQHVTNAPAFLERIDWELIDRTVQWALKNRLRVWADIYGTNPYNIPDGMSVLSVQHTIGDGDGTAMLSIDPTRRTERTRAKFDTASTPLPVVHSDTFWGMREQAVAERSRIPLDVTNVRLATDAVARLIEQLAIGLLPTYTYAGGTIYGLINHPAIATKTLTAPTAGGWTPVVLITQLLAMMQALYDRRFYGPYVMYYGNGWDPYFNADYNTATQTYTGDTLLTRIQKISKIAAARNVDYLPALSIIIVQMTPDVVDGIQGMSVVPVQWQEAAGMETNVKILGIQVPRVRQNWDGFTGINYGSV